MNHDIAAIDAKIINLQKQKREILSKTIFVCASCKAKCPIKKVNLFDKQWYVKPYSCTGGDYWKHSEWTAACPSCGKFNRMLNWGESGYPHPKSKFEGLEYRFKSITEIYEHDQFGGYQDNWVNNYD